MDATDLNSRLPYLFGNEIDWFHKTAKGLPEKSQVAVLGAGPGLMCLSLLEGNPTLQIYTVDRDPAVVETFNKHLNAAGFHVPPFIMDTCHPVLLNLVEDESLDLLVIDADHSFHAVKRDVQHWWRKVKYDGLILFHDYIDIEMNGTNGVARAVGEMEVAGGWQEVEQVGISIVFRKVRA